MFKSVKIPYKIDYLFIFSIFFQYRRTFPILNMSNEWITVMSKRERALQKRMQERAERKRACKIALTEIGKALTFVSSLKMKAMSPSPSSRQKVTPSAPIKKRFAKRGGRRLREKRALRELRERMAEVADDFDREESENVMLGQMMQKAFDNAIASTDNIAFPPNVLMWDYVTNWDSVPCGENILSFIGL